jgi:hypothetical protein
MSRITDADKKNDLKHLKVSMQMALRDWGYGGELCGTIEKERAIKELMPIIDAYAEKAREEGRQEMKEKCAILVGKREYDPHCECETYCRCSDGLIDKWETAEAIRKL